LKGKWNPERTAVRHGREHGEVRPGGRRVQVERPRVRTADGESELPLSTYEHFADRGPLEGVVLERMLAGVSTRQYGRAQGPVGEQVEADARSTSKSAAARVFVQRTGVRGLLVQKTGLSGGPPATRRMRRRRCRSPYCRAAAPRVLELASAAPQERKRRRPRGCLPQCRGGAGADRNARGNDLLVGEEQGVFRTSRGSCFLVPGYRGFLLPLRLRWVGLVAAWGGVGPV
jgi:hypothetical protein